MTFSVYKFNALLEALESISLKSLPLPNFPNFQQREGERERGEILGFGRLGETERARERERRENESSGV